MPNTGHSHLANDLSSRTGPHEEHTNMRIQPKPATPGLLCRSFRACYGFPGKDYMLHTTTKELRRLSSISFRPLRLMDRFLHNPRS